MCLRGSFKKGSPILKLDSKIRVCANYKVMVNKDLEDVKNPLPRIEELFAALQGD